MGAEIKAARQKERLLKRAASTQGASCELDLTCDDEGTAAVGPSSTPPRVKLEPGLPPVIKEELVRRYFHLFM